MEEGVKEINDIDDFKGEYEIENDARSRGNSKFWLNLRIRENMIIQKVRMKWLSDGDVNNKFLHKVMKKGLRRNYIGSIYTVRGVINSVHEVKNEVYDHFEEKFKENDMDRPLLDGEFIP